MVIAAQAFAGAIPPPFMPTRLALPTWVSGVGRPRRLFFTPTILARFQANYVNPYCTGPNGPIAHGINFRPTDDANQCVVDALHFLATGATDPTLANSAATKALNYAFTTQYVGFTMYAEPAAFVLDWCGDVMSSANRTALINKINTNMTTHIAAFTTNNSSCNVDQGETSGRNSVAIGLISIQGEAGTVDRNQVLRDYMQNWTDSTNEGYGDGVYGTYMYEDSIIPQATLAYEIATGQDTGFAYNLNRAEVVARMRFGKPGFGYNVVGGDQTVQPLGLADGGQGALVGQEFAPYMAYALASHYNSPLWQWIGDTGISSGNYPNWAYLSDSAMWLGVAMWDSTIVGQEPVTAGLKKNRYYPGFNSAHFRDGWTAQGPSCVDVRAYLWSVPPQGHTQNFGGALCVYRGQDDLLHHGGVYSAAGGSGRGYVEQDGGENGKGWAVGSYSRNTINFSSFSVNPDTDGQQMDANVAPPAYATYLYTTTASQYTPTANIFNNRGGTGRRGEITYVDIPAGEPYATVFMDISDQYDAAVATQVIRKVTSIPGASPGQCTYIVRDQFTLPAGGAATQRVKVGWFSRQKPGVTSSYPAVLRAGTVTAGIINHNGAATGRTTAPTITSLRPASSVDAQWELFNGGTTHSNNLALEGNAVAGATVNVYVDGVFANASTADAGGNWAMATGIMSDGAHSFAAAQVIAGVTSPLSLSYTITVVPNITAFSATSGSVGAVAMGAITWTPINGNKAWSLTQADAHTLDFEIRSGDVATNGNFQTTLQTTQLFGFNGGPFITFEFMITGPVNDQFGAGKWFIFVEVHDTLSSYKAPTYVCLGGLQTPLAGGDQAAIDIGHSATISPPPSPTFINKYSGPALARSVWHSVDMSVNPNNNAADNSTTSAISASIDGVSVVLLVQGAVGSPIGYFAPTPPGPNSHYVRIGIYSSGGTQTQHIKIRNVLCKRYLQAGIN